MDSYKQQLEEKKAEIAVLRQIIEASSYNLNLKQVLDAIVEMVTDYMKADSCFIYLVESGKKQVRLEASKNPRKAALGRIKMKMGEGITGWVAQHEKKRSN